MFSSSFPSHGAFAAILVALIISSSSFSILLFTESSNINGGFSVNIIHRDSPKSPLIHHDTTTIAADPFQRLNNVFLRSQQRYKQLVSTTLIPSGGEYLMKISYGTPPFESLAIVDTGSFLTWIQCLPCTNCYREDYPPFNPKSSSTFRFVDSSTYGQCPLFSFNNQSSNNINAPCHYRARYGDGSYSDGHLANDILTFGGAKQQQQQRRVSFPNFIFGCGHDNAGFSPMQSGLVGLGPESLSLVSQLSSSIPKRFSYCLVPLTQPTKSGKLSFGEEARVSGPGVVSTPLVINNYYSLIIESISVAGNAKVDFADNNNINGAINGSRTSRILQGGGQNLIIIDSGSTLTYLPSYVLQKLIQIVRSHIRAKTTVPDPSKYFALCYPSSLRDEDIPIVTFHFKGAAVDLKPINTFIRNTPTARCFAFTPAKDSLSVFGNIAHSNFLVGYDLEKKSVSFKPMDCANY